ncbi:MAG TPA: hypothetical protein VN716_18200 [Vicinamibacterales bacterium]|nr:hypothetical protein [Vicinamibacterales bacterium]
MRRSGGWPASAFAQLPSRLPEGTRVRVTTMNRRVQGSLAAIDRDGLTILSERTTREAFSCARIQRIDTRGDRPWNGAVIGAAIIALPAWNGCQNKARTRPASPSASARSRRWAR